jgi:hypothetical protein
MCVTLCNRPHPSPSPSQRTNEIDGDEEDFNNTLSLFGGDVLMKIQKAKWFVPLTNIVLPK